MSEENKHELEMLDALEIGLILADYVEPERVTESNEVTPDK
ncbi:hypothetical protein [Vibrio sp. SCSIO 43136]|nr:hypothetical protein [Vibrio sp. SCSIO 43136]